jgi:hypothetical protein
VRYKFNFGRYLDELLALKGSEGNKATDAQCYWPCGWTAAFVWPVTFTLIGVARGQETDWRVASRPVVGVVCRYRLLQPLSRLTNFDDTVYLWLCSPLLDFGRFFSFLIFYTVGRTPWTGDQPVSWPLPAHRTARTQNKLTHRHPCLEWDLNSRSQCLSGRRRFMP